MRVTNIDGWALLRPYKWTLLLGGLLILSGRGAALVLPYSTKYLFDTIVLGHQPAKLPWLIAVNLAATVTNAGSVYWLQNLLGRASQDLIRGLRTGVQQHLIHLPIAYFDTSLTGTMVSRIMNDVENVRHLAGQEMLNLAAAMATGLIVFTVLLLKSWWITLAIAGVLMLVAIALKKVFAYSRPIARETNKVKGEVSGRLAESLSGIRVVKGYRAESREAAVFAQGAQRMFENGVKTACAASLNQALGQLTIGSIGALAMLLCARLLLAGRWTTGDYVQYTALVTFLISPVYALVNFGTQYTEILAGLDRVNELLAERVEDSDAARTIKIGPIDGDVRMENVSFAYEPDRPVLHEVAFASAPGSVTALVGSSGSGKSTVISLLCAFHKPNAGRVLVDAVDLSTVTLGSYRSQLGIVLQDSSLFSGTIRENVLFSNPGAGQEEFLEACRMACVDEFAERFPKGYDTILGERGVKLSGGQRQRLSIARAILADPRILILDEATSSLDSESEAMIQRGLEYLMAGRTTFVIAHRLSTIRRADQILVLEQGRILERGTHEKLYALGGRYYDLYTRQHGLEANLFLAPSEGR